MIQSSLAPFFELGSCRDFATVRTFESADDIVDANLTLDGFAPSRRMTSGQYAEHLIIGCLSIV
ncbi:MAG TPA: hypothetical protein PKD64_10815 [Pirellulaceae bacterium]|nr:hypothetical protein [Pirellulaceae bacterium]HMO92673.1 hypothetical protein [Pirellulaceae bacterium]HMP70579.1 hypothetical protein [Pirellulaceae bacterium]